MSSSFRIRRSIVGERWDCDVGLDPGTGRWEFLVDRVSRLCHGSSHSCTVITYQHSLPLPRLGGMAFFLVYPWLPNTENSVWCIVNAQYVNIEWTLEGRQEGRKEGRETRRRKEGRPSKNILDRFRKLGFLQENPLRLEQAGEEFYGDRLDKDIYNIEILLLQKEVINGFWQ